MDPAIQALQDQLTQQAALLAALQAHPALQQPQPGPFAFTPAFATQDVIDMSSSMDIQLYKSIVSPLETKFDGSTNKMMTFLDVQEKANNCVDGISIYSALTTEI
jgi:hypothetical protein